MLTQTALFQEPSMPQWHCVLKLANVIMKNVTESGGCTYFASGYIFLCRWWWLSFAILYNNIQISPEGEVNSDGYIQRREASRYISTDPEGDSCFSIYQVRWIKKLSWNDAPFFFSIRKTVNIRGYSELLEPIKMRENCYPLIWWILKYNNLYLTWSMFFANKLVHKHATKWILLLLFQGILVKPGVVSQWFFTAECFHFS